MNKTKVITSKENTTTCAHNHFFNPICERNSVFKKIITIAFYAFTFLWIPLVAYRIYETKFKRTPHVQSQQPPVTFQSHVIKNTKKEEAQKNSSDLSTSNPIPSVEIKPTETELNPPAPQLLQQPKPSIPCNNIPPAVALDIRDVPKENNITNTNERYFLSDSLFEQAKCYIDEPEKIKGLPKLSIGHTPVYLPKELPVVLKESGSPASQKRFDQIKQGHDICDRNGYKHLVIPPARVHKNYIIEAKLPITTHTKEQMAIYSEYREQFTPAVKEFMSFLCQCELSDIVSPYGRSRDPYVRLAGSAAYYVGRYDNLPLYLENGEGKIGLIDLEQFSPKCAKNEKEDYFDKCKDAILLFPYHYDEILDVAKKFNPHIEFYREKLEKERDLSLDAFRIVCDDHLNFIKNKGIKLENSHEFPDISSDRKEELKKAVVSRVLKAHEADPEDNGLLGEDLNQSISLFRSAFPKILDLVINFLQISIKKKVKNNKKIISSYPQLVCFRSLLLSGFEHRTVFKKVSSELERIQLEPEKKNQLISCVIKSILKELAKGKDIAFYTEREARNYIFY